MGAVSKDDMQLIPASGTKRDSPLNEEDETVMGISQFIPGE